MKQLPHASGIIRLSALLLFVAWACNDGDRGLKKHVPQSEPYNETEPETLSWQPDEEQIAFLDQLQEDTFAFFLETVNPENGLVPDRYPDPPFASIAAVGFGLSSYIIGVERGYITREEAARLTRNTMRFFWEAPQGPGPSGYTGYKGFFYHFLDMETGERYQNSELSTIDTALLLAGMLTSREYFDSDSETEREIRALADSVYARVDWQWVLSKDDPPLVGHGWYPEDGFIPHDYTGYDESMILYLLALGAPDHPVDPSAWEKYTETYEWSDYYGYEHVNASPLFLHQYSHMFVDFRGIRDGFMRERGIDYFENSRSATLSQRQYAIDNPGEWAGYGELVWGLTACDGPGYAVLTDPEGTEREYYAYRARGASNLHVVDDGTIAPTATGGSVPFAPQQTIETLHHLYREFGEMIYGEYGFPDSFNFTYARDSGMDRDIWVNDQYLGIDQGAILIQIENYRSELLWEVMRRNKYIRRGLERAGFTGGRLEENDE